jgi:hypothetical protein
MPTINDIRGQQFAYQLEEPDRVQPYQTILLIERNGDGTEVDDIRLPHNPESYESEYTANWSARKAPGVERDLSDFENFDPARRRFDWLGEVPDPQTFEESVLRPLESAMRSILDETQEAPRVLLLQGSNSMRGHISSLSIKRVRTDAYGNARVAEISLTLIENDDQL